ncbi:multicopper oxidase family protein [Lentisalinibacter salinarum]|uniref:multicopper oxidase family protein n=1 Tax=Lentisalinibacter salinarum TaxID=2992239 RepID=UPI003863A78D
MVTRRTFLQATMAAAAAAGMPWHRFIESAYGVELATGLSDPAAQLKFVTPVPDALSPTFKFRPRGGRGGMKLVTVGMGASIQQTGLTDALGVPLSTPVFGYGDNRFVSWPGRTFEATSNEPLKVIWENNLGTNQLPIATFASMIAGGGAAFGFSPLDESLHWAYGLHTPQDNYKQYSVANNGIPIVAHVHGGHSRAGFDGNPEYFFGPVLANGQVRGPRYVTNEYVYDNDQPAGTVWYHDHALGITRLNVYAGLAGFYIIRDAWDTGRANNTLSLPAWPYEAALAIQDKMFTATGELFYPAFPGDPFYADFIDGEGADLSSFQNGGPTALAEFFGDHIVVNGAIWPKMDVEPRNYRLRLLNGCDSRFLVVRFRRAANPTAKDLVSAGAPIPFTVIGSDQGLASIPTTTDTLVIETGSRYDIIFDFKSVTPGDRIIMENIGSDTPFGFDFGDDVDPADLFENRQTDRIMAFDVLLPLSADPDIAPTSAGATAYATARDAAFPTNYGPKTVDKTRKVALFEGTDEYGRLQPLLGTAEPAVDADGMPVEWPNQPEYVDNGLTGPMQGSIAWHSPTTENPKLGDTEQWEIFNVTGDSHPIHLHLVHFGVVSRHKIVWDSNTIEAGDVLADGSIATEDDETRVIPNAKAATAVGDGTYLEEQVVVQHNKLTGSGFRVINPTYDPAPFNPGGAYVDANAPKDMVTARPGEVTIIRATFDKPGRYVWHCHILSHEDHEMMRALYVGPGTKAREDWENYTLHGNGM